MRLVAVIEQPARDPSRSAADVKNLPRLAQLVPQQRLDQAPSPAEPEMRLLHCGQLPGPSGTEGYADGGDLSVNLLGPSHNPTLTRRPATVRHG